MLRNILIRNNAWLICMPFLCLLMFSSCYAPPTMPEMPKMPDQNRMNQQIELMNKLMKEPDTSSWYKQRDGVIQAMGDRVFDKSFDRVFDSVIVAMANLGAHVENMERQSGYISARGGLLPPDQTKQLRREALLEYCKLNGYDPGLLDKKGQDILDPDAAGGMMEHMMTGLTIALVKQGENQTKVKLRFANTYYPALLQEYYKAVWPAIDKQIFLDKNLD